jgi:RHS repeat-associated protein
MAVETRRVGKVTRNFSRYLRWSAARSRFSQFLEQLESRLHLSAVSWTGSAGDNLWTTAGNWSGNAVPGAADDVTITLAGSPTIQITTGTQSVNSLVTSDPLKIMGGVLAVQTTLSTSATLTLAGGTLRNGTISATGSGALAVTGASTLDGVTLATDVAVTSSTLTVLDGLTLSNANLSISGGSGFNSQVIFSGNQTLGGTGQVLFGGTQNTDTLFVQSVSNLQATLTVGANITIHGGGPGNAVIQGSANNGKEFLLNQGTINADLSGKPIVVGTSLGGVTNAGTIEATGGGNMTVSNLLGNANTVLVSGTGSILSLSGTNWVNNQSTTTATGATLTFGGSWTNTGTVNVTGGTWNLGGAFTTAAIGTYTRSGGTINLAGALDNTSSTLALTATTGSWNLAGGGDIKNGTVTATGGASLAVTGASTLDGVTLATDVAVTSSTLTVLDGLTLSNANLSISGGSGFNSQVIFSGNQTLGGTGQVLFGGTQNGDFLYIQSVSNLQATLTVGAKITIHGGGPGNAVIQGFTNNGKEFLINQGTINADLSGKTITVGTSLGGVTNQGALAATNGGNLTIVGPLTNVGSATLTEDTSGTIRLGGSVTGNTTNVGLYKMSGTTILNGTGTSANPQLLEVMSPDLGNLTTAFSGNAAYANLSISGTSYVRLVDQSANSGTSGSEALYANSLIVPAGTTLDLNGLHVYVRAFQNGGTVINGTINQLPDAGQLSVNSPTPGQISTAGELDEWSFFGKAGQSQTIVLDPGSGAAGGPISPMLKWGEIQLLDPSGNVLATTDDTTSGGVITIDDITLPTDGTYKIRVRAATTQTASTGNYVIASWNVTSTLQALNLNQQVVGNLATPYTIDQWNFAASAGTQVQFDLTAASANGLTYTLTGPGGFSGFSNLTTSSSLINLTASGTYTLTAHGSNGASGKYGFEIAQTSLTALPLGTPFSGSFVGSGQAQLFTVPVTASNPLSLILSDPSTTDHAEIYARFGAPPTRETYDYAANGSGANHSILVPDANPGTWYVLVYGESIKQTPSPFTLSASSSEVVLTGSTPAQGASNVASTLTVNGAGFNSGTTVSLVSSGGTVFPATTSTNDLPTQMTAIFAAGTVPAGTYSIKVTQQDGASDQLANAFTMAATGKAILTTHLEIPNPMTRHIAETLYVDYSNTGTVAMAAPLLTLDATNPEGQHGALFTLDPSLVGTGLWTSATPAGFSQAIQILGSGATPGVLQPGETERIPVYYAGWLTGQWDFTHSTLNFTLSVIKADSTTAVNWASLQNSLQPAGLSASAWNVMYQGLLPQLGTTSGGYVQMLDNNASYLGRLGENITDVAKLWQFSLEQSESIRPLPDLAITSDDSLPTLGTLALSFNRAFNQTIPGRFQSGLLGLGWSVPWGQSVTVQSDGSVLYNDGEGMTDLYEPDSRTAGAYFSEIGDTSILTTITGGYKRTNTDGTITTFNANGTLNYVQDTDGNRITAGYTGTQLITLTASSGGSFTLAYNTAGHISTLTDSTGRVTTYAYDSTNQFLTSVTAFNGQVTTYTYNTTAGSTSQNALTSIAFPGGTHQFFTYNAKGLLASTFQDGNAQTVTYTYNIGQITTTDALGNASSQFFNEQGAVVKSVDALGNPTFYTYDSNLNVIKVTNALGESETAAYNTAGLLTSSTDFLGDTTNINYSGPLNLVSGITDAKGNTTKFAYDAAGNLLSTTYANGSHQSTTFNPLGEATSFTNANGQPIAFTYNASGQVATETYSGGTQSAFTYDAHGNLASTTDATGTTTFTYDPTTEFLTKVTYSNSTSLTFTYNAAGQRTKMVDQTGYTVNYVYDAVGRLTGLTDTSSNPIVTYVYDAAGRLISKTNGNGSATTYQYDANGNVLHLINTAPGGGVNSRFDYVYNKLGEETSETTLDGTWTYTYDADGQLTNAVFASTNINIASQNLAYTYDASGNRISSVINGVTTAYATNNMNQYTSVGGSAFTYDANGNLLSDGTSTYTYNALNQLTSVTNSSGTTTYTYNALGERIASTAAGQTTQYLNDPTGIGTVVGEYTGAGTLIADFTYGYGLVSQVHSGTQNYYDFDAAGNTVGITGSAGSYENTYSYLPFGASLSSNQSLANHFQFAGQFGLQTDATGLTYTRARYYSVTQGRFTAPDPSGFASGNTNFYTYALNSPTQFVDATGFDAVKVALAVEDTVWGTVIGDATAYGTGVGFNVATGQNADLANNVIGATVNVPGLPSVGTVVQYSLDPQNALNIVNGIQAIRNAHKCGGLTNLSEIRQLQEAGFNPCGPGPDPQPPQLLPDNDDNNNNNDQNGGDSTTTNTVNAQDPNAMYGPNGFGAGNFIQPTGAALPYQVDFENAATATAPAQQVNVTDQLSANFDWSTFQLTGIGWGDNFITIPLGSQHFQTTVPMTFNGLTFDVEVEAGLNTSTGQVFATFQSIDPNTGLPPANPLTGFLPPEDGTGRGDGFLSFSVTPKANLATGTQLRNVANITFDQGLTIATNQVSETDPSAGTDPTKEALVTIDAGAPASTIQALPATTTSASFAVAWSGQDDANGSGIADYDIYVSDNGGAFTPWLTAATTTSGAYPGANGHTYGFYSVAHDNVGNVEPTPAVAEAFTTVNTTVVAPNQLVFAQPPAGAVAGTTLSPVIVDVEDSNGVVQTSDNSLVSVAIVGGSDGATLLGTVVAHAQSGVATFSDLSLPKSGTYTLVVSDGSLAPITSGSFVITAGVATHMVFSGPSFDYLGKPFSSPLVVILEDAEGNVADDNSTVTLKLATGVKGGLLHGTLTAQAVNGVATFTGLSLTKAGAYTLQASDGAFANITTNISVIQPPAKIVFKQQPTTTLAGHTISPITVLVEDSTGHVVTTDNSNVTLSVTKGVAGATFTGNLTVQAVNGIATFTGLSTTAAGTFMFSAADAALKAVKSAAFTVNPDASTAHFIFVQQPTTTLIGKALTPSLIVRLQDQFGNIFTTDHSKVTLGIVAGPANASLGKTITASVAKGLAIFNKTIPTTAGTYTISVSDPSFPAATPLQFTQILMQATTTVVPPRVAASYASSKPIVLSTTFKSNVPASIPFTGSATIVDQNNNILGTAALSKTGAVKFSLTNIAAGTYISTLAYPGDLNHTAITSSTFTLTVV